MATELRGLYEEDPDARRVIDVARGLEGLRRQDGIHAAAVVITRESLTEYLPIQRKPEPGTRHRRRADGHAVRDARRRRPRPAEDGLPRPAQPRRDGDRARPHRALHRDAPRHRQPAARRRADLRPVAARRHDGCVPARRHADARAVALAEPDHVRRRRGRDRAVPAGPDGAELAQRVRRPQERPQAGHVRPPRPRGDPRAHVRVDDLPRAADARCRRSSPATRSKRPTTCARPPARRSASSSRRSGASSSTAASATGTRPSSPRATSTRSSRSPTTRSTSRTASATASSRTKPRG